MPLEDDLESRQNIASHQSTGGPFSGLFSGPYKFWAIGGIALVGILAILYLRKASSEGGKTRGEASQPGSGGTRGNVDPTTGYPFGSPEDVASLRTYGALGGGGRFNMGAYPKGRGGYGGTYGLGGSYVPPYDPVDSAWVHGLAEPQFPVGPSGPAGAGNIGATGMNNDDVLASSQALTVQPSVPINWKHRAGVYTVKPGDNLEGIAVKYGIPGGWRTLFNKNASIIGPDPDMLLPGTRLQV